MSPFLRNSQNYQDPQGAPSMPAPCPSDSLTPQLTTAFRNPGVPVTAQWGARRLPNEALMNLTRNHDGNSPPVFLNFGDSQASCPVCSHGQHPNLLGLRDRNRADDCAVWCLLSHLRAATPFPKALYLNVLLLWGLANNQEGIMG